MVRSISQRTSLNAEILKFKWKLERISHPESCKSGILDFCGFQCMLILQTLIKYPYDYYNNRRTYDNSNKSRVSITLRKVNSQATFRRLSIQSFIEDGNKESWYSTQNYFNISAESEKIVWEKYLSFDLEEINALITDGTISFVFIFTSNDDPEANETVEKATQVPINAELALESLSVDLSHLLENGNLSDVTLQCGDHRILAHWNILSSRSEVFAAMLRSDMTENRTGIVEISNMSPSILDQLVQFIYSGKLSDVTMDTASRLHAAGDMYAVESLKKLCSDFMKEHLTEDNACDIVALADAHNDPNLKKWAVLCIMQTNLIQKDVIWLKFCEDHPKLATDILNRLYKEEACVKKRK